MISVLLIKGASETIVKEATKSRFLSVLLGTLGVRLLGNLLTSEGTIRACGGTIRAEQDF